MTLYLSQRGIGCVGEDCEHFISDRFYCNIHICDIDTCGKCKMVKKIRDYHHTALTYYYDIRRCHHLLCDDCVYIIGQLSPKYDEIRKYIILQIKLPTDICDMILNYINLRTDIVRQHII